MEAVFEDGEGGETATLEVSETATAADLLQEACAAFGRAELDSTLEVDGAMVCTGVVGGVSGGEASVGSLGVHSDSRFVLGRSRDRVLAVVEECRQGRLRLAWSLSVGWMGDDGDRLPEWVWNDEVVALAAVAARFNNFKFVSERLRTSDAFMREAGTQNGRVLQHASDEVRGDKKIVLAAVASYAAEAMMNAGEELKADKEFLLASVAQNVSTLEYACGSLRADKDFILAAVAQNATALRYASAELKDDKDLCAAAYGKRAPRRVSGSSEALAARYTKLTRS